MVSTADNTAKKLAENGDADLHQEPSMEEILASIKQIIADDDASVDGPEARAQFNHPDNPSNSNQLKQAEQSKPVVGAESESLHSDDDMHAAMEAEMQHLVEPEAPFKAQVNTSPPVRSREVRRAEVRNTETVSKIETLEERAARIRSEVSSVDAGLSADDRLEQYRVRGRLQMEALAAAKEAERKLAASKLSNAQQAPTDVEKPVTSQATVPSSDEVASKVADKLLADKADEVLELVGDLLRPTIRQWLSDNLPALVEKLVREEIQSVSRGSKAQ